ncbi:MAG: PAS domain-containing sensor histidine kinase [Chitinispirillaceae bacterium]|nr:PAS domain-containing sensor histidine kinase [Chitinispirillaceae bacterium]
MKKKKPNPGGGSDLRKLAENKAGAVASESVEFLTPEQVKRTLHELRVHQIELEMQNEELRRAQVELETSHARYFDLYDLAPVGYCTISDKNLILEANLMIADLLGKTRGALVKQPFSRFILPEDQDIYYTFCRLLFKEMTPHVCELRLVKKDKTTFWARLAASPDHDTDHSPVFRVVISDVTERKNAEESLQKVSNGFEIQVHERTADLQKTMGTLEMERRRFNDVLELLPAYVVLLTPDYHVPFANRFFTERFGRSGGRRCFEYLFGRTGPCEICEAFTSFTTHAPHHWEWTGPDNRTYDIHDFPFTDADGSPLIMEMGIDITDRKQAEAALIEANEMKLLGQLTSGVAHEVRNPLNGIMAVMGALSKELSDDNRFQPHMRHMRTQITRLSMLMEDLLALGRPLRKENLQEIPMVTLVESTLATWLQAFQSHKPPVRFIKPESPEKFIVKADETSIMQVIINLLENAVQHSPEGAETVCSVDGRPVDKVVLSVKDRGTGIPEEILLKIFDPFFTTRKGGTGLGLSIVRRIVDNHQGTITACNNTDGPGATFEAVFPLYGK